MSVLLRLLRGAKVRFGRRGVRWPLGPRKARLHVGGGYLSGVSTGAGPFTMYRKRAMSQAPAMNPQQRRAPARTRRQSGLCHSPP